LMISTEPMSYPKLFENKRSPTCLKMPSESIERAEALRKIRRGYFLLMISTEPMSYPKLFENKRSPTCLKMPSESNKP